MTPSAAEATAVQAPARRRRRVPFAADVLARVGLIILILFGLVAAFGNLLPIGSSEEIGVGPSLAGPSSDWPAGTDSLGRSLLPRLVEGLRTTFLLAGLAVALTAAVGVLIGMLGAYCGGVVDELIARCADVMFAFPALLFALLVVAVGGPGTGSAVVAIALTTIPTMVRVVRAASLRVVGRDFIVAAKVGGAGSARILLVHLLPSIAGTAVVQGTYLLSVGMLIESGLSFLGLGVQPPHASLGSLVNEGAVYLPVAPWLVLIPGVLLALVIMSVNLVGDGLRDVLDVRATEIRR
jgi:peptide/nickel transport system permease protein